ncbi:MAG: nucleotidyltransferase [Thermoanaerobaculales bacterium]
MPPETVDASSFSSDIQEFLRLLHAHEVRFVIVGGEAVIFYGHIRVTGDIDVFYDREHSNAVRLFSALQEFWQGEIPELEDPSELEKRGVIFQFGIPPNRIDLLNDIDGIDFETAWRQRTRVELEGTPEKVPFSYIGLEELIQNKRASGRPKDLDDLPFLLEALKQTRSSRGRGNTPD